VLLPGRNDEVFGLGLLQHQPLRPHIVTGVPPVTTRIEISEVQALLKSDMDSG
jgi:hypothetical protein